MKDVLHKNIIIKISIVLLLVFTISASIIITHNVVGYCAPDPYYSPTPPPPPPPPPTPPDDGIDVSPISPKTGIH